MKLTNWLDERSDNKRYNLDILTRLERYVFPFFNGKNLDAWCRNENQRSWLDYLVEEGLSVSTIQACRNAANMHLKFIAELSDGRIEYNKIRLTLPSLTTKKKYKIEKERKAAMKPADVTKMEGQYVSDIDFEVMMENCNDRLRPLIWISYKYGLRLAECVAVIPENYRNDYMLISEQAASKYKNKYLKGVLSRKSPHFNLTMEDKLTTKDYIAAIERANPTSISRDFKKLMKQLHMNYRFHDLRGTWITNLSLAEVPAELIRQAAGHRDMSTTNRYLRDPHVDDVGNEVFGG